MNKNVSIYTGGAVRPIRAKRGTEEGVHKLLVGGELLVTSLGLRSTNS